MTLDDAIAFSYQPGKIGIAVESMCTHIGGPTNEALNALSLDLASRYWAGTVSFTVADYIINRVFAYATTVVASLPNRMMPEPMFAIFLAFDSGEFTAAGDCVGTTPELKYTRPQIQAILERQGST